jgi:hypothetical protein
VANRSYYTLIASLPALPPSFEVERDPITRPRLQERLKLLEDDDAATVRRLQDFLNWDRQPLDRTDEEVVAHYEELTAAITNRLIRRLIDDRVETRTILSALRRRRADLPPPIGIEPWAGHIRRHWSHPEFNLQARHPWIGRFQQLTDDGDILEAERLLFSVAWDVWSRLADFRHFSFEAVILYLARWEIIDRWTSRDATRGRQRFEQLISETLGKHGKLNV